MPTFSTWERATLDRFAAEAYAKLQQQDDEIQQLKSELKKALHDKDNDHDTTL
jgi:hypothetical protein